MPFQTTKQLDPFPFAYRNALMGLFLFGQFLFCVPQSAQAQELEYLEVEVDLAGIHIGEITLTVPSAPSVWTSVIGPPSRKLRFNETPDSTWIWDDWGIALPVSYSLDTLIATSALFFLTNLGGLEGRQAGLQHANDWAKGFEVIYTEEDSAKDVAAGADTAYIHHMRRMGDPTRYLYPLRSPHLKIRIDGYPLDTNTQIDALNQARKLDAKALFGHLVEKEYFRFDTIIDRNELGPYRCHFPKTTPHYQLVFWEIQISGMGRPTALDVTFLTPEILEVLNRKQKAKQEAMYEQFHKEMNKNQTDKQLK
jgi:hypothetical protein